MNRLLLAAGILTLGLSGAHAQISGGNTAAPVAAGSIDTAKIANGAVGTDQLAPLSVDTTKIAPGAVDTTKILNGAVGTNQLAPLAVDTTKIAPGAVDTTKILNGAVSTIKLAPLAVDTTKIAPGSIDSTKLTSGLSMPGGVTTPFSVQGATFNVAASGVVNAGSHPTVQVYTSGYSQLVPNDQQLWPIYFTAQNVKGPSWWVITDSATLTVPPGAAGWYDITYQVQYPGSSALGYRGVQPHINGGAPSSYGYCENILEGAGTTRAVVNGSCTVQLVAGDVVTLKAFHNAATAISLTSGRTWMTLKKAL